MNSDCWLSNGAKSPACQRNVSKTAAVVGWHEIGLDVPAVLARAATLVAPHPSKATFQERSLEDGVKDALLEVLPAPEFMARRRIAGLKVRGWDPQPGSVDIVIGSPPDAALYMELKVDDIQDGVWDIVKLASLVSDRPESSAVIAVAAVGKSWQKDCARTGLFDTSPASEGETWETRFLIREYAGALAKGLTYRPRPHRVPRVIGVSPLGAWPVSAYPTYELRAFTVSAFDSDLVLVDGWPQPIDIVIADEDLAPEDIPDPSGDLVAILHFATTSNGYVNFGNRSRLLAFAGEAHRRWRDTGELPPTLKELRSFLFALQRADHFGFPIDERFARALVGRIGELALASSSDR